ncbi:hypothetical protein ACGFXB_43670 [Streptomyces canus]|uniref:terminase gpP N-terminus-related DNA-binding protein n=1 Tax=Streptomyces canus TaxID=58343 RepID=UPI0037207329
MLTREEDVDAHALRRQGWTISAIARHLGRDRKTIRAYLNGERTAGQRRQAPDAFVPFRTVGSASPTTRTCGHPRCSTRWWASAMRVLTRRSPAPFAAIASGHTASLAMPRPAATSR